jgi:hypothetical protein
MNCCRIAGRTQLTSEIHSGLARLWATLCSPGAYVSITCAGEYVGLKEIDDGVWNVYFGPVKLGRLLERHMRIEDEYGRLKRKS